MSRKLSFQRIGTTEDTGDPVVKAKFVDVDSYADIIITDDCLRVWFVQSVVKGDMKRIIDEVVEQTGINKVHFLEPDVGEISEHLNDFERKEEIVDGRHGKQKSIYLETQWVPD